MDTVSPELGLPLTGSGFPSTHWTDVVNAGQSDSDSALAALERLIHRYQGALLVYLGRKFPAEQNQAEDWLQDFLVDKLQVLCRQAKKITDKRFRSFLLCAWHNFLTSKVRRELSQKRMPPGGFVAFDTLETFDAFGASDEGVWASETAWAREVIKNAIAEMLALCQKENRLEVWGVFEHRVLAPILGGQPPTPYVSLVRKYGLKSPIQAHGILTTGKRMFNRCLRSVVAEYARQDAEITEELRELRRILAH